MKPLLIAITAIMLMSTPAAAQDDLEAQLDRTGILLHDLITSLATRAGQDFKRELPKMLDQLNEDLAKAQSELNRGVKPTPLPTNPSSREI